MKLLKDLYQNHSGKVSDKWDIYLKEYEDKLNKYQKLPIKFFEIGILNGGSLEIFSKYFEKISSEPPFKIPISKNFNGSSLYFLSLSSYSFK